SRYVVRLPSRVLVSAASCEETTNGLPSSTTRSLLVQRSSSSTRTASTRCASRMIVSTSLPPSLLASFASEGESSPVPAATPLATAAQRKARLATNRRQVSRIGVRNDMSQDNTRRLRALPQRRALPRQ